jgi:hypothetical protein
MDKGSITNPIAKSCRTGPYAGMARQRSTASSLLGAVGGNDEENLFLYYS